MIPTYHQAIIKARELHAMMEELCELSPVNLWSDQVRDLDLMIQDMEATYTDRLMEIAK